MWVPTGRLVGLLFLGALLLLPGAGQPLLWTAGAVWNLLVLTAVLADALATPRRALRVTRACRTSLSLGVTSLVRLRVRNDSPHPLRCRLRDEVPPGFGDPADPPPLWVAAGREAEANYRIVPSARGRHRFGGVTARWRCRLGLLERQEHWPLAEEVRVYPNLRGLPRTELLQRAGRQLEAGLRAARLRGAGTEFESLRDYQPDDEPRRIHWGATARRGRLTSRQFEVERSQTVLLCLDLGRLMTARLGTLSRLDHAINAALTLAGIATHFQDRVGLLAFAEEPLVYLPPAAGRSQLTRLLEATADLSGRLLEPDYGAAFRFLGLRQRKRALVVLFTELIDAQASEALLTYTAALRGTHLPIFASLTDPALLALASRRPDDLAAVHQRAQAGALLAARATALARLGAHGLAVVDAPPEKLPTLLVERYLELKTRLLL